MEKNISGRRRAIAVAAISLLVAVPLLASAQVGNNDPLGRQIVNRIFAQLCARGILRGAVCAPTPPAAPSLTLVKTVVNDNGGTATTADFQAKIDGINVAWGVTQTVAAGSHTASETSMAGYGASGWGGDCAADGTITLAAGENKTCTITNDDQSGRLIVDKITVPAGSGAVFTVTATGTGAISGSASGTTTDAVSREYMVAAGTYSVTEAALAGWMEMSNTCVNVAVGVGETKTCTITNHRLPKLTVTKIVINDSGGVGTTTDFALMIDGNAVTSGASNIVATGTRMVSEGAHAGYTSTIGGDCIANGSITLAIGDIKTCTVTNDDMGGVLIVDKVTEPGGSAVEFTITASGTGAITGGGAGTTTDATSKSYEVTAGTYSVSETIPAGWMQVSNTCTDVAVAAGATETCVITNAKLPTLTVEKVVVNDNGGTATTSDFALFVDGMMTTSGVATTSTIGAHTVSETASSTYSMSISGDCAVDGSITLAAGDVKTCTITNDDNPPAPPTTGTITIIKVVVNNDEGTATSSAWTLHLHTTGDPMTDVSGSPQAGSADGTTYSDIAPGTYHVEETGGPAGYTMSLSGDCNQDGTITIAAGESKTCTVTNDDTAPTTGKLLINEVLYDISDLAGDPQGTDPANEWVEIFNGTNVAVDLSGYTLNDNNSTSTIATSSTMLASGKYLVVTGSTTTASLWAIPGDTIVVVLANGKIGNGLANEGDRVFLRTPTGVDVDAVSWGSNTSAFTPSVPLALDGYSIERQSPTTDTDDAGDWTQTISPTPGS